MIKAKKIFKTIGKFFYKYRHFWKKLGVCLITFVLTTILIFLVLRLTPGDTIKIYAETLQASRNISYEEARKLAVQMLNYDPDAPLWEQFGTYISGLFRGELGKSIYTESITANTLLKERLPWTLFIATLSLILSFLIGTAIGAFMASHRKGLGNFLCNSLVVGSSAIPDYIIGLLLVMAFAYALPVFPASGHYDAQYSPGFNFDFIVSVLYHAFLPVTAYTLAGVGSWAMMMRSSMIGVLGEDYISAARVRGLPVETIQSKYIKRNAMLPLITSLAISFAGVFGGAPLMESVFNYPGIGSAITERIARRDFFVVQGILLFSSGIMIFANLVADLLYSVVDPRVRRE